MARNRRWVVATAMQLGYEVRATALNHYRCAHPLTSALVFVCDSGDQRTMRNTESMLRRGATPQQPAQSAD